MYTCPIQMNDVRYNATNQSFEATVTVHDNSTIRTYACAFNAPISMSFAEAAKGLSVQAIRRHQMGGGLFSETRFAPLRARAPRIKRTPAAWLHNLLNIPKNEAA